jgi:hypothetical protein
MARASGSGSGAALFTPGTRDALLGAVAQTRDAHAPADLIELRARMSAWDRSFVAGHGRHPDRREWAGAARVVGGLPFDQAEALAEATYAAYGPAAPSAPTREDFESFAGRVIALRARPRIADEAVGGLDEWPVVVRARASSTDPAPIVRAAAPIVLAGLAIACWVAHARTSRLAA